VSAGSYLVNSHQSFSLIIGSSGMTFTSKSSLSSYTVCGTNQQLVHMTAMDHGGNGWQTGNSYTVMKNGVSVTSGIMTGSVGNDFLKESSLCLDHGTYEVQLLGSQVEEMGFEIDRQVYLSRYQTTGTFTVPFPNCGDTRIYLILVGSLYGVPYGWNGETHYQLKRKGGESYLGTLVTGMTREHDYCIPDGKYELAMVDVPTDGDDFVDDTFYSLSIGVEEYLLVISIGNAEESIDMTEKLTFELQNGIVTSLKVSSRESSGDDDDSTTPALSLVLIIVVVAIGVAVIFGILVLIILCAWKRSKRVQAPTAQYQGTPQVEVVDYPSNGNNSGGIPPGYGGNDELGNGNPPGGVPPVEAIRIY
jgi:hypothetical protein